MSEKANSGELNTGTSLILTYFEIIVMGKRFADGMNTKPNLSRTLQSRKGLPIDKLIPDDMDSKALWMWDMGYIDTVSCRDVKLVVRAAEAEMDHGYRKGGTRLDAVVGSRPKSCTAWLVIYFAFGRWCFRPRFLNVASK